MFEKLPVNVYKKFVKNKVKSAAFKHLLRLKENHSKVKHIKYADLQTQPYLLSDLFSNKDTEMLFNLRSKTDKNFKENFPILNKGNVNCPLFCWVPGETPPVDSQVHLLNCMKLRTPQDVEQMNYEKLFGNPHSQREILTEIKRLLALKTTAINQTMLPDCSLDPSTVSDQCCDSTNFVLNV